MTFINLDTKLSDVIIQYPSILAVLNRFGIALGVGDHTVASVCREHDLDSDFFLTILSAYLSPDYFPEKIRSSFDVRVIVDYIEKTNNDYQFFHLPNIERHFGLLMARSANPNNLSLILRFFNEVKQQLLDRIQDDHDRWFPEVLSLNEQNRCGNETVIKDMPDETDSIEDKIDDLVSMFVVHLKGDYDSNLCQAVLMALVSLKRNVSQNNRIRTRILAPMALALKS